MACLSLTVNPLPLPVLAISAVIPANLSVMTAAQAALAVTPAEQPSLAVNPDRQAALSVDAISQAKLTIGEVCTVTGGTIVVLAASDGPLRTSDGGYFLLNPATNPPEE